MPDLEKKLALTFQDDELLELYYQKLKGILLAPAALTSRGMILDLNSLPTEPQDLKTAFIRWMIEINSARIKQGLEPIITLELAMKCPIWKVIKPPLRKLTLTDEKMINKPSVKTLGQKDGPGSINKR